MEKFRELKYGTVCLDFMGSGGQGGALISPRKTWERSLKFWYWSIHGSFGLFSGLFEWF